MPEAPSHTIGEVINQLREEFPDLTVSKVRFLEGQGLIQPGRSPAGYRVFSEDDISRIRYILREQRDHFLPLKVIKSKLTAWEHGEELDAGGEAGPPPEAYFAASGISMSAEELARSARLTMDELSALMGEGILKPLALPDGSSVFRDDDLIIARAAHRLLRRGLEPRHLRTIRLAADRKSDLIRQLVEPLLRHRNPDNRRMASETMADCSQAAAALEEGIVRSRLRGSLGG